MEATRAAFPSLPPFLPPFFPPPGCCQTKSRVLTTLLLLLTTATGIVLCSPTTRSYLINYARSLIYTTAMAFPSLASIQVTYGFLLSGRAGPLLRRLRDLIRLARDRLGAVCRGLDPPPAVLRMQPGRPESPIIPLFTLHPRSLAEHCQRRGFMVRPIVAPTVPLGSERVRVCLHAGNTVAEVEGLAAAVEAWVRSRLLSGGPPAADTARL